MRSLHLVKTIPERCRVCYTCVRECPAKAIRIAVGQAEVIPDRCIGCGNCLRVCSQNAKQVLGSIDRVRSFLRSGAPTAACLAPSFPAEFDEIDWRAMVGMVRALGFARVNEVAFGADLVADRYRRLLEGPAERRYIATTCPAVVAYVERYAPELLEALAPIVSPMVALARALRRLHGPDLRVVFIGPCIAKKGEAASVSLPGEVDAALTFTELREMFAQAGLSADRASPSDFDGPRARLGALFGVSRGLLQAAEIREDLTTDQVVAADGRTSFVEAVREFAQGHLDARLLEVLACHGCIMGPGVGSGAPLFRRRAKVRQYAQAALAARDESRWRRDLDALADLDLSRSFQGLDQRMAVPFEEEIAQIMARMGKLQSADELNCGACGYDTCREHAVAIFKGLAESEMCLPHTIEQLRKTVGELAVSNRQLASAQQALVQSEKMASMGQLAAGIAHEVNNPLGVVLMYAHLLMEQARDAPALREDLAMIVEQADRCKKIVSGLLHFARQNKPAPRPTRLDELVQRTLGAAPVPPGVKVRVACELADPTADVDGDQLIQVLTNLVANACDAMPVGGELVIRLAGEDGRPSTGSGRPEPVEGRVRLIVSDTGTGIPPDNLPKIFEPFFTTKPMGRGTGLGLAVSYGIVKRHDGEIRVQSNADPAAGPTGSTFTVCLPRRRPAD